MDSGDKDVELALHEASQDQRVNIAIRLAALLKATGMGESWITLTFHDIDAAMVESLDKHGRPTKNPLRGLAHCSEELGEVAREATDATRPLVNADIGDGWARLDSAALRRMYKELCQLSAYSALFATSIKLLAREVEDARKAK